MSVKAIAPTMPCTTPCQVAPDELITTPPGSVTSGPDRIRQTPIIPTMNEPILEPETFRNSSTMPRLKMTNSRPTTINVVIWIQPWGVRECSLTAVLSQLKSGEKTSSATKTARKSSEPIMPEQTAT